MRSNLFLGAVALGLSVAGTSSLHAAVITTPTSDIVGIIHDLGNHYSNLDGNYNANESPVQAIDGDLTTKYLNFGGAGLDENGNQTGNPSGFIVTLPAAVSIGSFRMATGNDFPSRDPATLTIEGGNFGAESSTSIALSDSDSDWTSIYSGTSGITVNQDRETFAALQSFAASAAYSSFRVIITDLVRYDGNAPTNSQFSEIELNSPSPTPEPASLGLIGLGGLGLLRRRRRA